MNRLNGKDKIHYWLRFGMLKGFFSMDWFYFAQMDLFEIINNQMFQSLNEWVSKIILNLKKYLRARIKCFTFFYILFLMWIIPIIPINFFSKWRLLTVKVVSRGKVENNLLYLFRYFSKALCNLAKFEVNT